MTVIIISSDRQVDEMGIEETPLIVINGVLNRVTCMSGRPAVDNLRVDNTVTELR